jgi:hypothetical protein
MPVYLHEIVDCIAGKVTEYLEALETELMPLTDERKLRCCGFFQVAGSSGRWPQLMALWELEVADHVAQRKSIGGHQGMRDWMSKGAQWRTGGFDRILLPHPFSPRPPVRPQFHCSGCVVLEQTFNVRPDETTSFVTEAEHGLLPAMAEDGLTLQGFWRSHFRPLEHIAMWSMPDWDAYGRLLERRNPTDASTNLGGDAALWNTLSDVTEKILIPLRFSPLGGGATTSAYTA